jgi:hypothetical protein
MRNYWILKAGKILLLVLVAAAALSYIVMMLWNYTITAALSAQPITFWQALGLLILAKILFGFGKWGGGHWEQKRQHFWKFRMEERLKHLSPEERERFRSEWRKRCGWNYSGWEEKTSQQAEKTE